MPEGDFEMEETRIKTVSTASTVSATAALPKFKLMMLGTVHGSVNFVISEFSCLLQGGAGGRGPGLG